jgi:hypothetical protein
MAQIFQRPSNTIARASIFGFILLLILCGWGLHAVYWSPFETRVDLPLPQPVPFSHQHHVGGLGIDCRYCHTSVETSAFAGMPQTETCMTCHSRVWTDAPMLAPVRASLVTQTPLQWNRVNDLPDFVFFNHSIHVNKGIGCSTCHGAVDRMPLTWKANTLYMKWCLDCHREPERFVRPKSEVFNMDWQPSSRQSAEGQKLVQENHIQKQQLTDCGICHR